MLACLLAGCLLHVNADQPKAPPLTIGRVIIVGNTTTPDEAIRALVKIGPGAQVTAVTLKAAELRLAKSGLFVIDRKQGIRPRISLIDAGGGIHDLLIDVREKRPRR